jgi:hypothetical protein
MKIDLTASQRTLVVFAFFAVGVTGFLIKLPSAFRSIDKELHATFYFLAAAFLNILLSKAKLIRHGIIFITLFLFGMAIEYGQAYSNRFFQSRIHGRFDPEDVEWNLKGLVGFSLVWLLYFGIILIYMKAKGRNHNYGSKDL